MTRAMTKEEVIIVRMLRHILREYFIPRNTLLDFDEKISVHFRNGVFDIETIVGNEFKVMELINKFGALSMIRKINGCYVNELRKMEESK